MSVLTLTPFLFTSNQELNKTAGAWYVMWINPESVDIDFNTNQSEVLTKGGYGWFHWRNKVPQLKFSGVSGWVYRKQIEDTPVMETIYSTNDKGQEVIKETLFHLPTNKLELKDFINPSLGQAFSGGKLELGKIAKGLETPFTWPDNDARVFVQRLQRVALQPMFFYDMSRGYRRYNTKFIQIYTKRYPEGQKIEGFFTSFQVPEKADDTQLIHYNASFTVQKGLEDEEPFSSLPSMLKVIDNTVQFASGTQTPMKFISNILGT